MADVQRRLAPALYFLAFLLVATPLADFALTVAPYRLGNVTWRFAACGLLSGFLLTPLLGAGLAIATAAVNGHRRTMRVLGISAIVLAVLLVLALGGFALDTLQLRRQVPEAQRASFHAAALKAMLKHVTALAGGLWLGIAAMRAARAAADAVDTARASRAHPSPGFIVASAARD